ncbi:hypothetical protein GCM10009839_02250 [Catenulispora yoronensis]|uniref:Uncharacterized protein n=1 Tax=Catenulispora yoronensis TaxID=450799 RepID=A0ABN2TJA5_9ACTN
MITSVEVVRTPPKDRLLVANSMQLRATRNKLESAWAARATDNRSSSRQRFAPLKATAVERDFESFESFDAREHPREHARPSNSHIQSPRDQSVVASPPNSWRRLISLPLAGHLVMTTEPIPPLLVTGARPRIRDVINEPTS